MSNGTTIIFGAEEIYVVDLIHCHKFIETGFFQLQPIDYSHMKVPPAINRLNDLSTRKLLEELQREKAEMDLELSNEAPIPSNEEISNIVVEPIIPQDNTQEELFQDNLSQEVEASFAPIIRSATNG